MTTEETKKRCDELVEAHQQATSLMLSKIGAAKHAILSTENTIEVLEALRKDHNTYNIDPILVFDTIAEQNEILKELKSRL